MSRKSLRNKVYAMFDGHCAYCGREITKQSMQVDHKNPKWKREFLGYDIEGGAIFADTDRIDNLFPSCRYCNNYKGGDNIEGFRNMLKNLNKNMTLIFASKAKGEMLQSLGIVTVNKWDGKFYFEKYDPQADNRTGD